MADVTWATNNLPHGMTWVFLAWLLYRTRVWAVGVALAYYIVENTVFHAWIGHQPPFVPGTHEISPLILAWGIASNLLGLGVFVWMILSLMRWGRKAAPTAGIEASEMASRPGFGTKKGRNPMLRVSKASGK
jgi:hypothetical protein